MHAVRVLCQRGLCFKQIRIHCLQKMFDGGVLAEGNSVIVRYVQRTSQSVV